MSLEQRITLLHEQIVKWLCLNLHPFTTIEEEGFLDLVELFNNDLGIPSADTIKNKTIELYERKKSELKKYLTGFKMSFTLDIWTSKNYISFLAVTAHFVDESFRLRAILLDFIELPSTHHGSDILDYFWGMLEDFNLCNKVDF